MPYNQHPTEFNPELKMMQKELSVIKCTLTLCATYFVAHFVTVAYNVVYMFQTDNTVFRTMSGQFNYLIDYLITNLLVWMSQLITQYNIHLLVIPRAEMNHGNLERTLQSVLRCDTILLPYFGWRFRLYRNIMFYSARVWCRDVLQWQNALITTHQSSISVLWQR